MTSTRWALRGARYLLIVDKQIFALDEFDAHLLGEEGMFEIRAVEATGSQQDDRGFRLRRWGQCCAAYRT